jgi:hypothetical protein
VEAQIQAAKPNLLPTRWPAFAKATAGQGTTLFTLPYRSSAFALYFFAALGDQKIACFLAE